MRGIEIPELVRAGDAVCVVSVSGGKDSTATILALREADVPARYVFADTGWEAQETYDYLDTLRARLGIAIDVVGRPGGMVQRARDKAGFPVRSGRWCTEQLKVEPLRVYYDAIERDTMTATVSVVGIRAEESVARAKFAAFEDCDRWGGWVWRPILAWSVADVLDIHHRHGVPVNPLYLRGHNRVGCYPCIMANKDEVRLIATHSPDRIEQIAALEAEFTQERARRNADGSGKFAHPQATFFMSKEVGRVMGIHDVVAWSRTIRGGRQLDMLPPDGGCFRWGLCEAPAADE